MPEPTRKRDPLPFDDFFSERLAWWMDSAIGIGPVSIGLDGIVGMIPGLGDFLTGLAGVWIVVRAMKHGVHHAAILRMLVNLGIDALVGAVPVAGDLFDFAFKANIKNMKIYRESLSGTRAPLRDWGFIAVVAGILLLLNLLPFLSLFFILRWLGYHFFIAAIAFVSSA